MAKAQHAEMLATQLSALPLLILALPLLAELSYCLILIDGLWLRRSLPRIMLGSCIQIDTARGARDTHFAHGTRTTLTRQCDRLLRFGEGVERVVGVVT